VREERVHPSAIRRVIVDDQHVCIPARPNVPTLFNITGHHHRLPSYHQPFGYKAFFG